MTITATPSGINKFQELKYTWQGPYSNEMCVMQELTKGIRTLEQLRTKFDSFDSPTLQEVLQKFEKTGYIISQ